MKQLYVSVLRVLHTRRLLSSLRLVALLPLLALLASSCITITTDVPSAITATSARLGGTATATASTTTITGRGVYYSSTNSNAIGTKLQMAGPGSGAFSQVVTGLAPNTTYYVRAYADANDSQQGTGTPLSSVVQTFTTRSLLAAPVVTTPANGSNTTNGPTYAGTAPAGSIVRVYVDGASIGTTTATGGNFSLAQPTNLSLASHTVYATAQTAADGLSVDSNTNTFTVTTAAATPVLANIESTNVTYTVGSSSTVQITSALTASDADSPTLNGATVRIATGFVAIQDNLYYVNQSGIAGSYNNGNGILTLTGTATLAAYQTALRSVEYRNSAGANATVGARVVTFVVSDGLNTSNTQSRTINVQGVTAAPVVTDPANGSLVNTTVPTYAGTAVAGSTVTVYVDGNSIGTATATGGNFSLAQPTALTQGAHTVYATAQASGGAVSANSNTNTFTVDTSRPSVAISSTAGASGTTTTTTPIPFTVTFSEPVTGFVVGDVTVNNGTITGGSFSGSGTTYTFTVTPTTSGTATTVSVPANVAVDAATNGNTGAPSSYSLIYNTPVTAAPVITAPADGSFTNTQTVTFSGTAPDGSAVEIYVSQNGTAYQNLGTATATGGTFSFPFVLPDATYRAYATAQSQGSAVSTNSNLVAFTVDTSRPSVAVSSTAGFTGNSTGTTPIPFTVTFSEPVTGFVAGDVTVTNGTITGGTVNGSGTIYTFTVTPTTSGTATTVSVPTNVAVDAAGNGNTATTSAYSITYNAPVTATTWNGSISTDWFTPGNWTSGVPTTTVDGTVPASAPNMPSVGSSTASVKNLTLNAGATLTQTGGIVDVRGNLTNNGTFQPTGGTVTLGTSALASVLGSSNIRFWNLTVGANRAQLSTSAGASVQRLLTLNGTFTTNGNPLTLESNATNTALVVNSGSNVVAGTVTVQRYIDPSQNAGAGYRHYSAPVSNSTVADLATAGFTPTLNPTYNTSTTPSLVTPFPTVFGYDQARLSVTSDYSPFDKGFFSPAALSDALTVGKGYTVNIDASQLVDFQGTLNNGTVTQALTSNRNIFIDGGWQLVGNPYPAPLDYSLIFAADRVNLDGAMYVYSSTSQYNGNYRSYTNGIGGNPVVASGQGFFVRVAAGQASASLTFRNSQRLTAPNPTTFQRTTADTRPLVQLTLRGATGTLSDDAYVYAEAGATPGVDAQYDAVKLPNSTGLNLSAGAAGQQLAIDGLPAFTTGTMVPLSVGVPAAGAYTLQVAQLLNLPAGTAAVLVDAQLGTRTDLAALPAAGYAFTVTAAQASALVQGRFFLNLAASSPLATAGAHTAERLGLYPNPATHSTTLTGASAGAKVTVFDAVGRLVLTTTATPAGTAQLLLPEGTATGVYVVRAGSQALRLTVE